MIRTALRNARAFGAGGGLRGLVAPGARRVAPLSLAARALSDAAAEPAKGTPYAELTVGVPKETFPREKRVAATPEVRGPAGRLAPARLPSSSHLAVATRSPRSRCPS